MTRTTVFLILLFVGPRMSFAQLPSGSVALYSMDNNTINDISGNGYNGSLVSTAGGVNRFGTSNGSVQFTSGSSTGTLPGGLATAMQNDFTIGYWFNTTMSAPSSSAWYGGSALVDAEVCGGVADWGTALIDGGKVSMGIGNPDITIKSAGSYNDGAWHFVTATRDGAAGVISLYVDGGQVATTSGTSTAARTAPTLIGLGRNVCVAAGVYTGAMDDVIAYSRALSSTEVSNLYSYYSSFALPLKWVSFTAQAKPGRVDLQWQTAEVINNDHFEIERSTDGKGFSTIGTVSDKSGGASASGRTGASGGTVASGGGMFSWTDAAPVKGNALYRIKQVDIDGKYSWSPTVAVSVKSSAGGISLQANPVGDVVTIVNPQQKNIRSFQVSDLSGRVLFNGSCNSSDERISENVGWLKPGYYILRVFTGGDATNIKFIKL